MSKQVKGTPRFLKEAIVDGIELALEEDPGLTKLLSAIGSERLSTAIRMTVIDFLAQDFATAYIEAERVDARIFTVVSDIWKRIIRTEPKPEAARRRS